jgi:gas vesicle protein
MSRQDYDDEPFVVIEKHTTSVMPFFVGLAVGTGVALLFAPRSGAATRRDIRRRARRAQRAAEQVATNVTDTVVESFEEARRRVENQLDSARQAIDLKREQVSRAVDAGRDAAQVARDELEQRLAHTKAAYAANDRSPRGHAPRRRRAAGAPEADES